MEETSHNAKGDDTGAGGDRVAGDYKAPGDDDERTTDRKRKGPKGDGRLTRFPDQPPKGGTAKKLGFETDSKSVVEMGSRKDFESPNLRSSLTAGNDTKICYFYKDNDYSFPGVRVAINPRKYKKIDTLLLELSRKIPGLGFGVRRVATPSGNSRISNLDAMTNEGQYVCSSSRLRCRGIDTNRIAPPQVWRNARPPSGRRIWNTMLQENESRELNQYPTYVKARRKYDMSYVYNKSTPKKINILQNGNPTNRHVLLLNRKTGQQFEQVLRDLSGMFGFAVRVLFTLDGARIRSLNQLVSGPDSVLCSKDGKFIPMTPRDHMYQTDSRVMSRATLNTRGSDIVAKRLKGKRERLANTRGNWKVSVKTSNHDPSASTQAQVSIIVYGHKNNSGPISLGSGDGSHFQAGNKDDFDISIGNVGEIYKIRISHDNSGDSPGWLCEEVFMKDKDTDEELTFTCKRWLARDKDDGEICRELPAVRKGEPVLQVIRYTVEVTTGNLWNAGTNANVYMTIYGERGDTGVRQLYSIDKDNIFKQGMTDTFTVEAVALGRLKRIIVGHDGTSPGLGWFLERIVIKETSDRSTAHDVNNFYCGKWLDEGEDDGKIVRELHVQKEYMDDILEKRNWEHERWKFEKDCQVKFYSLTSGKAVRAKANGTLDALGGEMDSNGFFNVIHKKVMVRLFSSVPNPNRFLAIDSGKMTVLDKHNSYCEFRIRVQSDRSVMLESVKNPLQFLTFGEDGQPADVRGIIDKEKTRRFFVYCKGMFRHRGIVTFATSMAQSLTINSDLTMTALGKRNTKSSQFRVHKKQNGGVYMFESIVHPGRYIRLKEGKIDVQGSRNEFSQFLVEKHKSGGYVSLQSASQRGLYLGMKPDGRVWPTVDTGVNNIYLYPEVVEWGVSKAFSQSSDTEDERTEKKSALTPLVSPVEEVASPTPSVKPGHAVFITEGVRLKVNEGDWSVHVTTLEQLKNADVTLLVFGDRGSSGPIALNAPADRDLFLPGNIDEFRANLLGVGKIFKIRLELNPKSSSKPPSWKVKDVKMTDLSTEDSLTFTFNRWLSREHDDLDIIRELPAKRRNEDSLPVLKYYVMVHTDEEEDSGTDANVYLTIKGDKGDTGKRALLKSNNKHMFINGQVDIFEVEAVSVGKLESCIVGHDGTASGQGWLLQQIVIRESEDAKEEYIFPCDKWLDVDQEDRKIERVLPVKEIRQVMVVEPIEEVEEEETYKEGDWNVWVMTGSEDPMATSNMVLVYAYGTGGCAGPLRLGSGKDGFFKPGATDKFKVTFGNETDIVYKVRIGHNEAFSDSGWYLEKLRLQDCSTGDEYSFNVNRWLSRSHDDGDIWREFAVPAGGKPSLPVLIYTIEVHTGNKEDASTTAGVFICLHGSNGDSGKRKLFKSKSSNSPFQSGATDVFELEAVSLGDIKRITVSHDGKGSEPAWYLDKVRISQSESLEDTLHFPCDRLLDSEQGDRKCEVDLIPGLEQEPEQKNKSEGEYSVSIRTAQDSKPANGGKVQITVYGEKGKSDNITLYAPNPTAKLYEPGNIDSFTIQVGDLGDLYKIRLTREDTPRWEGWHLQEIQMQDTSTNEDFAFDSDRWFSREIDDYDLTREFPVVGKSGPPPPVVHYEVSVTTGNHWAAETDADVYVTLFGKKGDFGRRLLYHSNNKVKYNKGQTDKFEFEAVSLGELTEVQIGHDQTGHGAGIDIEDVRVREIDGPNPTQQYIFPCKSWLDTREGDGRTWRVLPVMDSVDTKKPSPQRGAGKKTKGHWSVLVKTSDIPNADTHAQVFITGFGDKEKSKRQPLGSGDPNQNTFDRGAVSELDVPFGNIGDLVKIRLEHDNKNPSPSWHVDWIKMTDVDTNEEVTFYINRWFGTDEDDGQLVKEFSVNRPGEMPLPVCQYVVLVQTGKQSEASANNGHIKINLIGEFGDTGLRQLANSLLSSSSPLKPGQQDAFIVEAVSVGKLNSIALQFEGQGVSWYVERVQVFERFSAISQTVFNCHRLFDTRVDGPVITHEFDVTAIQPASCPPDLIERHYGDIQPLVSKGKWTVSVHCGAQANGGTSDQVHMVVYGTMGQTDPIHLNAKEQFTPGAVVQVDINVGDIGAIVKVHLYFGEDFTGSSWFFNKLKLKDKDTGQEFQMIYNGSMDCTEDNSNGSVELPAIRPDIEPLQYDEFTLYVATGNQPLAETSADIFCELIGDWGGTGRRVLAKSNNNISFKQGQVDEFKLKGLDLGRLREVVIGHNEEGRGKGWFCDRVLVKSILSSALKIFPCNRWMDTGCEDRQLVCRLLPLGEMPIGSSATGKSKGIWDCKVITADEDKLPSIARGRSSKSREVSLVLYGSVAVKGPVALISTSGEPFLPGQTDEFKDLDIGNIGTLQKVRLSAGYEQDPDTVWTIHKVILTDSDSGETFTFDFTRWLGEIGGDIRKELPAIQMGKSFKQVIPYYIEVYTSEEEMDAGTNAHIFITLYGMMADTGRRHLVAGKNDKQTFQTGQVDTFVVEAVDLGELEKIVVAKGPGSPWLPEKIVIKAGEFNSTQFVFEHNKWIGSKATKDQELEEKIKLTREMSSNVVIPASQASGLPKSKGSWKITTETGGQKGGDGLDLVVVFSGDMGESELCPLKSNRDNPFQIGQTDICMVKNLKDVGELYKLRLGYKDNTKSKGWFLRKITCEDEDTGDIFSYELGDWIIIDDKTDGWREIPVVWPAIKVPPVMKYQVIVHTGDVHTPGTDANVYVCLFGEFGSTGQRQLKHSLINNDKFNPDQVDQFEVEAVYLGRLKKVTIGHDRKGEGAGWYVKKVVITESAESIEKFNFPCNKWLDEGEDDGKIERTLLLGEESVPTPPTQQKKNDSPPPEPKAKEKSEVKQKSPTPPPVILHKSPSPEPVPTDTQRTEETSDPQSPPPPATDDPKSPPPPAEEKKDEKPDTPKPDTQNNEQKVETPVPEQTQEEKKPETPKPEEQKSETPKPQENVTAEETPKVETPAPIKDHVWRMHTVTGSEPGHGTGATVVLILYGDKGVSEPILIGQEDKYRFSEGQKAEHEVDLKEDIGEFYKVRVGFHGDNELAWYQDSSQAPSWFLEKLTLENLKSNATVEFDANQWIRIDGYTDFWKEFPVKKPENRLAVYNYQVEVWTGDVFKAGTDANVFINLIGERGDTGNRKLLSSKTNVNKFEQNSRDLFDLEAVDLGRLKQVKIGHDGENPGSGWFLEKIVILEGETAKLQHVFNCQKWLDVGEDDQVIERTLDLTEVTEVKEEPKKESVEGDFKVYVTTSGEDNSGTNAQVTLTVYGDEANSGALPLGEPDKDYFQTGQMDEFDIHIKLEDIGKIQKIRLEHNNTGFGAGWRVEKVVLEDLFKKEKYDFPINKWLSFNEKYGDIAVEVQLDQQSEDARPVRQYVVQTQTGNEFNAGTDALVHIALVGTVSDSGRRYLVNNLEGDDKFETGKLDTFVVEAVDLGRLETIIIGHDGRGPGSGWFLDKVMIKESMDAKEKYIFSFKGWLEETEDSGIVEVELYMDRMEKEESNVGANKNNNAEEDTQQSKEPQDPDKLDSVRTRGEDEVEMTGRTDENVEQK